MNVPGITQEKMYKIRVKLWHHYIKYSTAIKRIVK